MRTQAGLLILAMLVVLGCAPVPGPTQSPSVVPASPSASAEMLLTVGFRGGHCRTGSCDRTLGIDREAGVHLLAPERMQLGTLAPGLFQTIREQLSLANFDELGSRPFTGECPVNVDGQELIYTFFADTGDIRLASCEVELDPTHPLLVAIENALATVPQP